MAKKKTKKVTEEIVTIVEETSTPMEETVVETPVVAEITVEETVVKPTTPKTGWAAAVERANLKNLSK
jgi:hypothetical protein